MRTKLIRFVVAVMFLACAAAPAFAQSLVRRNFGNRPAFEHRPQVLWSPTGDYRQPRT